MTTQSPATAVLSGGSKYPDKLGLAYAGDFLARNVRLLVDETWTDAAGNRQVGQEIFDAVFGIIDEAEQFILLDFFLLNEEHYEPGPGMRNLSRELVERLVEKRQTQPDVPITFITDPVNTVYGSIPSPLFQSLEAAGVHVVWTELDQLRDSNPIISKPWRLLVKRWGTGPGKTLKNPMGAGRISFRSGLKLLNFKANHRKVLVTEKSLLVASANPHSASSAHWNMALRVDGAGQAMALESESAILDMSGAGRKPVQADERLGDPSLPKGHRLQLLTEIRIKEKALSLLEGAEPGARIDLAMFYLSNRDAIQALIAAKRRGCSVRVILDPSKDAFGRIKNGIPNRQSAFRLVAAGIPLRWADTRGEQCHVKVLYVEHADATATLLLGSCNYTRRNMENFNCECDLALTTSVEDETMQRFRAVFDGWWSNPDGRHHTVEYAAFADPSKYRRLRAWLMETTGMGTF